MDAIFLATVEARQDKTIFLVVGEGGFSQGEEGVASWQGMHVHRVGEEIFALFDLLLHHAPLPKEPIGNMGKNGLSRKGGEGAVLILMPLVRAGIATEDRTL